MTSIFQQKVKDEILQRLELGPATIIEIADKSDASYHSIRAGMRDLEAEGLVAPTSNVYRNAKFRLADTEGPNRIMQTLKLGHEKHKLITLLGMRHNDKTPDAVKSVYAFPRHIARLLHTALQLRNTNDPQERTLRLIRTQMENDLEALKRVVGLYDQVLENHRNWDPEFLRRYNNDVDFNVDEVLAAYNHYFNKD